LAPPRKAALHAEYPGQRFTLRNSILMIREQSRQRFGRSSATSYAILNPATSRIIQCQQRRLRMKEIPQHRVSTNVSNITTPHIP
jgi:hypothetical protein